MIDLQIQRDQYKVLVTVNGQPFAEYRYGHFVCRPYLYPVLSTDGQRLTRGFPTETFEGETDDHRHHRGIWVAHGLVNGADLWTEWEGHGSMLQGGDPAISVGGDSDDIATIDAIVGWYGPEGDRLLQELRSIQFQLRDNLRIIDHSSEIHAKYGDVTFGDTKEGGLIAIRMASSMNAKNEGRIENSEGFVYDSGQGEEETWGKRAAWVDYSGPVANGDQWGFTVVDHWENPRHPTHWHVRGYGLFTANPFGVHDFEADDSIDESLTIKKGEVALFRYRIIVHPGRGHVESGIRPLIDEFQES